VVLGAGHSVERQGRWLRRAALAVRIAVGLLAIGYSVFASLVAARAFGNDSPWFWTIALLTGLAAGVALMGNPRLHRIADRIERLAQDREDRARFQSSTPD
jgi:hypothetical protein